MTNISLSFSRRYDNLQKIKYKKIWRDMIAYLLMEHGDYKKGAFQEAKKI